MKVSPRESGGRAAPPEDVDEQDIDFDAHDPRLRFEQSGTIECDDELTERRIRQRPSVLPLLPFERRPAPPRLPPPPPSPPIERRRYRRSRG